MMPSSLRKSIPEIKETSTQLPQHLIWDSQSEIHTLHSAFSPDNPLPCLKNLSISGHLLVQSQQWKHRNKVWNLFKVNNNDIRTKSVTSFSWFYCYFWTDFTYWSCVSICDFEQGNAGWLITSSNATKNFMKVSMWGDFITYSMSF